MASLDVITFLLHRACVGLIEKTVVSTRNNYRHKFCRTCFDPIIPIFTENTMSTLSWHYLRFKSVSHHFVGTLLLNMFTY